MKKRYGFFGELAGGGQVSGPSGTDVVPARLTDGEFVMSKGAVDTFGTDFMESINAAGGGNNRPKKSNGTSMLLAADRLASIECIGVEVLGMDILVVDLVILKAMTWQS